MDGDVTDIVEDAVAGVEGVDYIMSQSLEGTSIVTVFFQLTATSTWRCRTCRTPSAPPAAGCRSTSTRRSSPRSTPTTCPVMWLTLSAARCRCGMHQRLRREAVQAADRGHPRTSAACSSAGLQARNIRIWLDARQADQLTTSTPTTSAAPCSSSTPRCRPATSRAASSSSTCARWARPYSLDEFEQLLLARAQRPADLPRATWPSIEDGLEDRRSLARFNRMPAVAVGVRKAIGGNLVAVCENVKKELPRAAHACCRRASRSHVPVDYSLFIRENVEELQADAVPRHRADGRSCASCSSARSARRSTSACRSRRR